MQSHFLSIVRDGAAAVFCCGNTQSPADHQAPLAVALQAIGNNGGRSRVAVCSPSPHKIVLNDYNKKDIVRQFHRCLTRTSNPRGSSRSAAATAKTLLVLSRADTSWAAASKDERSVAYVNSRVSRFFESNFDRPIELIEFTDSTIKDASMRGLAALEIVTGALRRSVSEADIYGFQPPEAERQSFPYAEILEKVLDLENVEPKIMNTIIAKGCNFFWQGPDKFTSGAEDFSESGFCTMRLDTMLTLIDRDLADASKRANPIALRNRNVIPSHQVWVRWPTLSEMTKVAVGIHAIEGKDKAQAALSKIVDSIQRAPHEHRIVTLVGMLAYADEFLDRRAYMPFAGGVASHDGEHTVDFLIAHIKQRLSKDDFGKFMDKASAERQISTEVKARAHAR